MRERPSTVIALRLSVCGAASHQWSFRLAGSLGCIGAESGRQWGREGSAASTSTPAYTCRFGGVPIGGFVP